MKYNSKKADSCLSIKEHNIKMYLLETCKNMNWTEMASVLHPEMSFSVGNVETREVIQV